MSNQYEVKARPIEPTGNLLGFASVKISGITVHDFKIVTNKDGEIFVGMPSKPDKKSETGYRNTVYVDKESLGDFNEAVIGAYQAALDKPPPIKDQMAEAGKQAAAHNANLPQGKDDTALEDR